MPWLAAMGSSVCITSSRTSRTLTGSVDIDTPPASMRDRSRMSSMRRRRWLAALEDLIDAPLVSIRKSFFLVTLQELGEAQDRVERGAQLVAHRGEEVALGGATRFRCRARLAQLLRTMHVVGQIPDCFDDSTFRGSSIADAQASSVAHANVKRRGLIAAAPRKTLVAKALARALVGEVNVADPGIQQLLVRLSDHGAGE